jgi:sortase (surface protein transpeptidase)
LPDTAEIFCNEYNVIIFDEDIHEKMSSYLNEKDLVLRVEVPDHGCNLWVYEYINNILLDQYLSESYETKSIR